MYLLFVVLVFAVEFSRNLFRVLLFVLIYMFLCFALLWGVVTGFGGDGGGVTPVSISNTVVKPSCADGTWT